MRELVVEHNANMFAADEDGRTPFDSVIYSARETYEFIVERQQIDSRARPTRLFHAMLDAAEYRFAQASRYQRENTLQMGKI